MACAIALPYWIVKYLIEILLQTNIFTKVMKS